MNILTGIKNLLDTSFVVLYNVPEILSCFDAIHFGHFHMLHCLNF